MISYYPRNEAEGDVFEFVHFSLVVEAAGTWLSYSGNLILKI